MKPNRIAHSRRSEGLWGVFGTAVLELRRRFAEISTQGPGNDVIAEVDLALLPEVDDRSTNNYECSSQQDTRRPHGLLAWTTCFGLTANVLRTSGRIIYKNRAPAMVKPTTPSTIRPKKMLTRLPRT